MDAIGDRDIKQAQRYLRPRQDELKAAFDRLDERIRLPQVTSKRQANGPAVEAGPLLVVPYNDLENAPPGSRTQNLSSDETSPQDKDAGITTAYEPDSSVCLPEAAPKLSLERQVNDKQGPGESDHA